jgi:hypothetical protein
MSRENTQIAGVGIYIAIFDNHMLASSPLLVIVRIIYVRLLSGVTEPSCRMQYH